ncbi:uncharacterized protein LOC120342908 [Styela clava]
MKIPIRHSFIGLILLMEACLLIKGEQCWTPMVCDDQLTWREITNGQCTKEEEKALEALTEQLDGMKTKFYQLKKTMEKLKTNSVPPSVVGVRRNDRKETTTPQVTVLTCPAPKAPDNGTVDTTTAPDFEFGQTIRYSCNAGYVLQGSNIGKCNEKGTWGEVATCVDVFTCDFESSINPTCGYTRVNGTFQREYRVKDFTGHVLAGTGTIRSLPKALADNEEVCMSVAIKGTSDGELVAKANNGTVTEAIWPFSASTTWKTEKFILKKINSADTEVQLELVASGNVELDNITTLNSSECYGLATPCTKRNLENATISPEQELYSKDQEVSYSCSNDSILEGEHMGTCKADGSWSTTPACTKCGVVYNSKCFRAIVYDVKNVTFSVAKSLCKNKLANIYDVTHFNLVRDYLRSMIPDGESLIYVCTGMSYKNSQLYSTTGQAMSLPTEVWRSDYPISQESWTTVAVRVHQKPEYKYQGIYNYAPTYGYFGAICENEL